MQASSADTAKQPIHFELRSRYRLKKVRNILRASDHETVRNVKYMKYSDKTQIFYGTWSVASKS